MAPALTAARRWSSNNDSASLKQTTVGYVTALNLGGTDLKADQTCKDPTSPSDDMAVVAVGVHSLLSSSLSRTPERARRRSRPVAP